MKLLSPIDVTVLTWLKPELDSTLHQARNSLEHYVEEGQSVASLRDCILHLHQVAGILNMVELAGAARLAEEMEQLALCLAEGKVQTTESAYSFLMQCIVQLPDYLERLQNGHRDVPTVLLPLANELRSIRGESALGEESVYSAATHLPIPEHAFDKLRVGNAEKVFAELALQFQAFLLAWLNNQEDKQAANNLSIACSQIGAQIQDESSRKVFWVASALLDAVANNKISLSSELRQAIIKIDQEVNYINNRIMGEVRQSSPVRLTQELLYFVSQNHTATDRMRQVYEVFELQQNIPDENEINHAKSSLLGRNNALFQSVATVIKEDILRVKDSLDMFIRNEDAAPKDFSELVAVLNRIENTLELIDANTAKDLIGKNKKIIQGFLDGANALGESELMAIAKSLLSVELMLDHHGVDSGSDKQAKMANDFLTSSQSHQLLDALIRESIVNFASARQAYVAFVESYWDHTQLATIPALFKQVSGALAILEFTPVSNFIDALNAFTRYEFIEKQKIPSSESMERLAEVLASLEYYLESVRDRRPNRERILEITQKSLEALNYWPVPEYALQTTTAIVEPVVASPVVAHEVIDTTPVVTPEAVVEQVMPVKPMEETFDSAYVSEEGETLLGFDANAEGIDDEIREIFLEEFAEESGNLTGYFESWQADQENIEHVRPIRRIFHTFKGSGRLVGAKDLSDFSWKIESLLNRVLDGSRPPTNEVIRMLSIAIDVLPKFNAAMLGETVSLDLSGLSDVVDRLAAGEDAVYKTKKAKSKPATRNDEAIASTEQVNSTDTNAAPSIDPVLLEILKPEVTGHVETVNAWLESAKGHTNPVFEDAIFRAVHTMNGAFAMSEVPSMSELLAPTETMLRRAIANNANVKSETIYFMGQVLAAVKQTLVDLSENKSPANYQELVQRAITLRDELP
ncbi:MAG TPA: Hpt domain-containing protein, partial [Arenimonas sp.]|nr:Hpt domain-containing protein [Arenimonas sp.]